MRLADFIETNTEAILVKWEAFARTLLPAADGLDVAALRDHAEQILQTVARDLKTSQSRSERVAKSRGEAPRPPHSPETAAETHALLRSTSGFSMDQMVAEYRALRAAVLELWADAHDSGPDTIRDISRFNEAIDQAVAESVHFFSLESERWRNVFLGVLGHDLRGPLNAILLTSRLIFQLSEGRAVSDVTARLIRGGERMRRLLDDLLDYSRASLDLGIPIFPASVDLAVVRQATTTGRLASRSSRVRVSAIAVVRLRLSSSSVRCNDSQRARSALGFLLAATRREQGAVSLPYGDQAADPSCRASDRRPRVDDSAGWIELSAVCRLYRPQRHSTTNTTTAQRTPPRQGRKPSRTKAAGCCIAAQQRDRTCRVRPRPQKRRREVRTRRPRMRRRRS